MKQFIPEQKFYLICEYYNEYLAASIHWENILLLLIKVLGNTAVKPCHQGANLDFNGVDNK